MSSHPSSNQFATGALEAPLLSVRNLSVEFHTPQGVFRAVDDLSFDAAAGRRLAVVGESGSGKSVTSMAFMRLTDYNRGRIASGHVMFRSRDGTVLDMTQAEPATLLRMRGNEMSMIFQEPMTSLSPVFTVGPW
ncbi:MAG: ATP-binding cassette domain-containing protein [Janthinobacterium lividum]